MKQLITLTFCLLNACLFADDAISRKDDVEKNKVSVLAFDDQGNILRSGVGFLWDEKSLVCAYSTVKGASTIKLEDTGLHSYSTRLISFNDAYDFAILKTEEEDMEPSLLAGSDTLAVGDRVYFFHREKGKWQFTEALVRGWMDSGQGYETIRLQKSSQSTPGSDVSYDPSPLYNESAKVIGWVYRESLALPLKAMSGYVEEPNTSIALTDVKAPSDVWAAQKVKESVPSDVPFECCQMVFAEGTKQYPFRIQFPEQWKYQTYPQAARFLLRAKDFTYGVSLELRIFPQQTEDLVSAIDRIETLIFSGMPRSELVPYSSDHLTGFKAIYDEPNQMNGYSRVVFYVMSKNRFCILSITYPQKHSEEMTSVIEMVLASFEI